MPIISKETWDKFTQEEQHKLKNLYRENEEFGYAENNIDLEIIFPKDCLQPQPLTYEDVEKKLKETEGGKEWVGTYFADKVNAIVMLLEVSKFLNKGWKPDFNNENEIKWYFSLEYKDTEIRICSARVSKTSIVYFRTKELAEQAILILGEDPVRLALDSSY